MHEPDLASEGTAMHIRSSYRPSVTAIKVFDCRPENQQLLIELLVEAVQRTLRHLPGFVESTLHRSLDGERIISEIRWRDRESYDDMLRSSEAAAHVLATMDLSTFDARFYEQVGHYEPAQADGAASSTEEGAATGPVPPFE